LAMRHDLIPVNYGWAHQIEGGITPATDSKPLRPLNHVMSNAFGFGGNDSSIILSRHHA
jgi:3-oxoacyl-(acyl-carrier-protein) synthase